MKMLGSYTEKVPFGCLKMLHWGRWVLCHVDTSEVGLTLQGKGRSVEKISGTSRDDEGSPEFCLIEMK